MVMSTLALMVDAIWGYALHQFRERTNAQYIIKEI